MVLTGEENLYKGDNMSMKRDYENYMCYMDTFDECIDCNNCLDGEPVYEVILKTDNKDY